MGLGEKVFSINLKRKWKKHFKAENPLRLKCTGNWVTINWYVLRHFKKRKKKKRAKKPFSYIFEENAINFPRQTFAVIITCRLLELTYAHKKHRVTIENVERRLLYWYEAPSIPKNKIQRVQKKEKILAQPRQKSSPIDKSMSN